MYRGLRSFVMGAVRSLSTWEAYRTSRGRTPRGFLRGLRVPQRCRFSVGPGFDTQLWVKKVATSIEPLLGGLHRIESFCDHLGDRKPVAASPAFTGSGTVNVFGQPVGPWRARSHRSPSASACCGQAIRLTSQVLLVPGGLRLGLRARNARAKTPGDRHGDDP